MTAFPKIIIVLFLWLLYSLALFWWGSDTLCLGCGAEEAAVLPVDTTEAVKRYPIDFQWSDATAFTNEGYESLRQDLMGGMTDDNILEIRGLYYEGEPAPEGYDNMGFARADRVRELLGLPEDRVELKARLISGGEEAQEGYFEAAQLRWTVPEETVAQTIEELPDRMLIRFPYNSTEEDYNPEVVDFLKKLSEQSADRQNLRILLTGHTDNSGESGYNMDLGLRRAQHIKNILVQNGFPADRISVESKGETQPVASNNTGEGRHENRRVEVRLQEQ